MEETQDKPQIHHDMDLLSQRAEMFRSKLIDDFHLLDSISEKGKVDVPKYDSSDISLKAKREQIMKECPNGLVSFQIYSEKDKTTLTRNDRRKNRVKNKNSRYAPIDMWAHWVVEGAWFQGCILALILTNCVVLGIQAEINDVDGFESLKLVLNIFDYCTLFIFLVEIILKWLDDFWIFWKNGWNIFDFFVTFLSFVPEILKYSSGDSGPTSATSDLTVIADNLRVFRVLRSLKMVTRFRQVRLIALAVAKAFQAMVFITLLLLTFAYIFAIAGVIFFDSFSNSTREDLEYKNSFSNILNTLITLFQLFTLDHWLDVLTDVRKVVNPWFAGLYVILWILIGSFIFKNIFVGIMVNNFQTIRNDLFEEVKEIENREQRSIQMAEFAEELNRQGIMRTLSTGSLGVESDVHLAGSSAAADTDSNVNARLSSRRHTVAQPGELKKVMSHHVVEATHSSSEFQKKVEKNLLNISQDQCTYCWPRDTLFHYFMLMEALMENLHERQELLDLAAQTLLKVHDT